MYKEHKIGVVIPAYNKGNHIKDTIETLPDFIDKRYVMDDGSADKTAIKRCHNTRRGLYKV
jgi:glycosyltransferase involved in cell wall biosynthesis